MVIGTTRAVSKTISWEVASILLVDPVSTDCPTAVRMLDMRCNLFSKTEKQKLHNTPVFPDSSFLPSYISGYVDGEGCFCVSINKNKRTKHGWEVRPSFSVSQNANRAEVLYLLKDYFGCGFIRADSSDKTLKYEVRSLSDLMEKIVPHFEKYRILSSKSKSFDIFKEVCCRMGKLDHLTINGLKEITFLAGKTNYPSKRKFREIKI